jgi:hypothetical protein
MRNTKISIFGGISKFLKLIVFGQILAVLNSFGQIWTDFAAVVVANSMPKLCPIFKTSPLLNHESKRYV